MSAAVTLSQFFARRVQKPGSVSATQPESLAASVPASGVPVQAHASKVPSVLQVCAPLFPLLQLHAWLVPATQPVAGGVLLQPPQVTATTAAVNAAAENHRAWIMLGTLHPSLPGAKGP